MQKLKLIECPRDAMQGLHDFIPTAAKTDYINQLLKCGFDTIDFGSFVSPKAIPQLRDTAEVLAGLDASESHLLAIVANERGANDAARFERIDFLGYPFSISEEFQKRNTNATIDESFSRVEAIQNIATKSNKELVLYLSMGFGNPYGEEWHPDIVTGWSEKLYDKLNIKVLALSDTIGVADPTTVRSVFETLIPSLPNVEFGAHLHAVPENAKSLVAAAYQAGCRRFDSAIKGFGGCPMAADDLIGNMPTELMKEWFDENSVETKIVNAPFQEAMSKALAVFP
ncbi:MAG: hydroxymethylglutaryl-CoA lyase [Crocinitomicaceae bacterium]|nr:hydroxymethylglutaryl-CoA lyase [Crocinitomicaceae bacterium]